MAKWKNVNPGTGGSMRGSINYDGATGLSDWQIYQDEQPFIDDAKMERDSIQKQNNAGHRKFATIPDIVAIEVMEKFGIDIHNPETIKDRVEMMKFKKIIMDHYPYLVVNKA